MHFNHNLPLLLALAFFASSLASPAQEGTYTLDQVRSLALAGNTSVLQSRNSLQSASGGVLAAYGSYLPSFSASASWSRSEINRTTGNQLIGNQVVPLSASSTTSDAFSTNFGLSLVLFNGLARESGLRQAKAQESAAEQSYHRIRQSIVFQCESGYLNVLRLAELVKVAEGNLTRDREQQEQINESFNLGARSNADVYRQQSQVANDQLALITARNNLDNARIDLIALLGLPMSTGYRFEDPSITTALDSVQLDGVIARYADLDRLRGRAKSGNPEYLAARENLRAADAGYVNAKSGYFPSLNASAGYRLSSQDLSTLTNNNTINWGLSLNWTLFDGFRTNQGVQAADVAKMDAELNLRQNEQNMNAAILKAWLQLVAARSQYDAAAKGLLSATEDSRIAQERYNLGAGTILDLQTANANLVNAMTNKINAAYNFHVSVRNIEYAIGDGR